MGLEKVLEEAHQTLLLVAVTEPFPICLIGKCGFLLREITTFPTILSGLPCIRQTLEPFGPSRASHRRDCRTG